MIKKELLRFALVGFTTVAVTYVVYRAFVYMGMGKNVANSIAYCVGVFLSFVANGSWTFNSKKSGKKAALKFFVLHAFTLFACVFVNAVAYVRLSNIAIQFEIAFVLGIATSTILNFIGMRHFVFTENA